MTQTGEIKERDISSELSDINEKISLLKQEISKKVVGQQELIDILIIGLFANGHILLEGLPGLAKTLTISTISKALDLGFSRVQFTPDLLPSDLIGTEIYNAKISDFEIKKGPIFNNFILADEINRAPSKVQSALLEAMAEKSITIGKTTFPLEKPFLVLATQNPIEQSGTYSLPEAQLDRFMFKIQVSYPSLDEETLMYKNILSNEDIQIKKIFSKKDIEKTQKLLHEVYVSDNIFEYVTHIIDATRHPQKYGLEEIKDYISYGVSPRGGLSILAGAKVRAMMENRSYVIPEDIKYLALHSFSHRIVLSYEAVASDITEEYIINKILEHIKIV